LARSFLFLALSAMLALGPSSVAGTVAGSGVLRAWETGGAVVVRPDGRFTIVY